MRWLIRKTESLSANQGELQDSIIASEKLSAGANTDDDLVLTGVTIEAKHLMFSKGSKGRLFVTTSSSSAKILAEDNKSVNKINLLVGQKFKLGKYTFTRVEAPAGIDYALSISQKNDLSSKTNIAFPLVAMSLKEAGFNMRRWTWTIMLLALTIGLILPLLWVYGPQKVLKTIPIASSADELWSPGPLAKVHHIQGIADNCQVCHTELLSPVKDTECKSCHEVGAHLGVSEHANENSGLLNSGLLNKEHKYQEGRCATCHIEHKNPSIVIRQDEPMCTACHRDIASDETDNGPRDQGVERFEQHPEFKLSLLRQQEDNQQGDKKWHTERHVPGKENTKESSNLEFSHRLHLNPKGIDGPLGRETLVCQNCHEPEQDGLLIKPITMEKHCRSCHTLSFEPTDLTRQVPHASLDIVKRSLEEYYSRLYSEQNGPIKSTVTLDRPAKRPGKPKPDFYTSMKEWSDDKAHDALDELVNNKACSTCHIIGKSNGSQRVTPVKISNNWYPKAQFDHSSHKVYECNSCHSADTSDDASDILIPDIKNCRSCHAGESDEHKIINKKIKTVSSCMSCHQYHTNKMDISHE
jgi:hypothetical protein